VRDSLRLGHRDEEAHRLLRAMYFAEVFGYCSGCGASN